MTESGERHPTAIQRNNSSWPCQKYRHDSKQKEHFYVLCRIAASENAYDGSKASAIRVADRRARDILACRTIDGFGGRAKGGSAITHDGGRSTRKRQSLMNRP